MAEVRSGAVRPVVVVSACLLGERCRYDGTIISVPWIQELDAEVRFVPVCPENGIGLPVPRARINLVRTRRGIRLVETGTGRDLTAGMRSFCGRFLTGLRANGFILKSRSPSCAVWDAVVCDSHGRTLTSKQAGLFAATIRARFAGRPIDDERALDNPTARQQFFRRLRPQGGLHNRE